MRVAKAGDASPKAPGTGAESAPAGGGPACSVCGKTRDEHEKRRFCFRDSTGSDSLAGSKGKGKGKGKQGKVKKQEKPNKEKQQWTSAEWKTWRLKKKDEGEK